MAQGLLVDEFAFLAFHRGVADHAGGSAHESDGAVAGALEVLEHHHSHEVPDMKRVGRRVNAEVGRSHAFFKLFVGAGSH